MKTAKVEYTMPDFIKRVTDAKCPRHPGKGGFIVTERRREYIKCAGCVDDENNYYDDPADRAMKRPIITEGGE